MTKETAAATKEVQPKNAELYLLSALLETEEALTHLTSQVKAKAIEVKKSESLGARNLTFPIQGHQSLILASVFFTAEPKELQALELELKHDAKVVRFLLTTWNDDINQPMRSARTKSYRPSEKPEPAVKAEANV